MSPSQQLRELPSVDQVLTQFHDWSPWVDGRLDQVPKEPAARREWLGQQSQRRQLTPTIREALIQWYGAEPGNQVRQAEAFELCEYGRRPSQQELKRLFPMAK